MADINYIKIKDGEYQEQKVAKRKILLSDLDREIAMQEAQQQAATDEIKRLKDFKKQLEAIS
jgi:predicted  nucleic acid-binding Zn-ribbon protein